MRRIVVVPGFVTSRVDLSYTFIDSHELMNRYDVPRRLCIVWDPVRNRGPRPDPTWPHLYPDPTGEYKIPPDVQKVIDDDSAPIPG